MTSVRGRGRHRRECPFVAPSGAPSIAPPDFSPLSESDDKLFDQPARPLEPKPPIANTPAPTSVLKYSEDDLQRIFKVVLEARAPVPTPAPVSAPAPPLIIAEAPQKKLKARSPDVYHAKST